MYVININQETLNNMKTITCDKCKSVIGYNTTDIITDYNYSDFAGIMSSILGEKEIVAKHVVQCPICGEYINIT